MQPSDRVFHFILCSQAFKYYHSPFQNHSSRLARVRLNDHEKSSDSKAGPRRSEAVRFGGDILFVGDHRNSQRSDGDSPEPNGECGRSLRDGEKIGCGAPLYGALLSHVRVFIYFEVGGFERVRGCDGEVWFEEDGESDGGI